MPRQRSRRWHTRELGPVAASPALPAVGVSGTRSLALLYRYCLLALGDPAAAADATLRAYGSVSQAPASHSLVLLGRLFRAAEGSCADAARLTPPHFAPAAAAVRAELATLPDDTRCALELQLCGWATDDVAAALGRTPRAVRALRASGLRRLAGLPPPPRRARRAALEVERRWAALRAGAPAQPTALDATIARLEATLAPPDPAPPVLAALQAQRRAARPPSGGQPPSRSVGSPRGLANERRPAVVEQLANSDWLPSSGDYVTGVTFDLPVVAPPPSRARRASREALQLLLSALIFGLLGALLALALRGGPASDTVRDPTPLVALPQLANLPRAGVVTQTLAVGPGVTAGPFAAGTALWLPLGPPAGPPDSFGQLDPATGRRLAYLAVTPRPAGFALAFGSVWVSGADTILAPGGTRGELLRLDPVNGQVVARIPLPGYASSDPDGIAADAAAIWVADRTRPYVWRVDPATNSIVATIRTRRASSAIATGGGYVWVGETLTFRGTLSQIDPASNQVVATFDAERVDGPLVYSAGSLWFFTIVDGVNTLARLDPGSGVRLAQIALPGDGRGLAERDGLLWVATSALDPIARTPEPGWSNTLLEVDPATNGLVAALPLEVTPDAVVVDGSRLWIYAPGDGVLLAIRPD